MPDNSLPATIRSAFSKPSNAFALHDDLSFDSVLQQSTASTHQNPFNDSAFSEPSPIKAPITATPKKEFTFLSTNNENLNAIFNSYKATSSSNLSELSNSASIGTQKSDGIEKNPFSAANEKCTWNELNALDLGRLQMELDADEKSSIFTNMNSDQQNAKTETKKEIPADLFKDVAMELFSEFNNIRHKNHEFYNKISGFDAVRT